MEARKQWGEICEVLGGGQKTQPRILYLAKLSSKTEGEIKIFPDKQNLTEFITSRPSLQDMLKGVLQV